MGFGRLPSRPQAGPISDINVTPMVDVMLVLLVIFLLSAPWVSSVIRLDLPRGDAGPSSAAAEAVVLVVDTKGQFFLNDQAVTEAALRERLGRVARRNPDAELELRADQVVPYGRVVEAMGLAHKAGLSRIGFVTQTAPVTGP